MVQECNIEITQIPYEFSNLKNYRNLEHTFQLVITNEKRYNRKLFMCEFIKKVFTKVFKNNYKKKLHCASL